MACEGTFRTKLALVWGCALVIGAVTAFPADAEAQDWIETAKPSVGVAVGTAGVGLEAGVRPWERVGARFGIGWIPYEGDIDEDDVMGTISPPSPITRLVADLFPLAGGFHLSAGLHRYSGGVSARVVARDSVEINDREYSPEEVGEVRARVWGNETAPYLGLGWQGHSGRIQPHLQVGVAFTGSPRITVNVTGALADDPTFQSDLDREIQDAEEEIESYRYFPHLSFGLRIRLGGP